MKKIIAFIAAGFPVLAFAQIRNIDDVAGKATNLGNTFITLAISFAVIWIIGSVVWYLVKGAANEDARKKGGLAILYGVVGLFVILSIWGLVNILKNSFQTEKQRPSELQPNSNTLNLPIPPRVN